MKYLNLGNNIEHKIKNSTLYKTGVLGYAENAIDKINMSDKGKDIFKNTVRVVTAGAIVLGACDRLPNKDSFTVTQPGTTPGLVVPPPDGTEISGGGVVTEAPFVTPISTEISIVGYGGQLTAEQQAFTKTERAQGMKIGLENYVNYWEEFKVFADGTQLSLIPYPDQSDPTDINKMVYVAEVSGDLNYDGFVITIPIAQYQKYLETGDPQTMLPPQNATSLMENTDPFKMTKQVEEGSIPNLAGIPIGAVNGVMNGEFVYFAPGTTGALEVVGELDENFKWKQTAETATIALFNKYGIDSDTYTLAEVDGVIVGTDNETGKEVFRDGRFEISFAVELAKKDCKPTDIEPSTDGLFILYESWDSFKTYISEIMKDLNFPPDVEGWGLSILIDREKQCWALANSSNIYYRDETGLAKAVPIIHLTEDEMIEFIDGMVNKQLVSP